MFNAPLLCTSCQTCREHDGMRPPTFRPNRSIGRRVMAFPLFSNMATVRHFEFKKKLIFVHVTVILVLICCFVPNSLKICSRIRPPHGHDYRMFNAPLLGNRRCHGNRIIADMSGTWWDATTQVSSHPVGPLVGELWHFQYFPTWRPSVILEFKKNDIDHVTVIVVLICCCVPNFIKIGLRIWPPDVHNCWMFNAPLLGNGGRHGNRIMADTSGTWWDATTQVLSKSVHW